MKDVHQLDLLQQRLVLHEDTGAFRQLFLLLAGPLRHFAHSIIHSKEQAEEIVEDVFVNLWQNRSKAGSILNLRVYLYVAIRNTAINYLKRKSSLSYEFIDYANVDLPAMEPDPEQLCITSEMRRRIEEVIQDLPPKCKLIFRMAREDRLKYREIAEILNISVKTIDNQLAIALRRISDVIHFHPQPDRSCKYF